MKKNIILLFITLIATNYAFSKEVIIKDQIVTFNQKEILKAEKINSTEYSFYSIHTNDEILHFKAFDNETPKYSDDDYYVLNFLTEKVKIESRDYSHFSSFFNSKKSMQKLIQWLIKEKVLSVDGNINKEKLEVFFEKYDENIVNRTMR